MSYPAIRHALGELERNTVAQSNALRTRKDCFAWAQSPKACIPLDATVHVKSARYGCSGWYSGIVQEPGKLAVCDARQLENHWTADSLVMVHLEKHMKNTLLRYVQP